MHAATFITKIAHNNKSEEEQNHGAEIDLLVGKEKPGFLLPVVPPSYTVVEPFAVVVKVCNTLVASAAVFNFRSSADSNRKGKYHKSNT